jgi:hypothetical protein
MARSSSSRKALEWRRRLKRFEKSRLSIGKFCCSEGISEPSSYLWRKRPTQQATAESAALFRPERGLRTFGMLCPLLPGVADAPEQVEELVTFVEGCQVEEVFAEAVNQRGPGLKCTEEAVRGAGFVAEAVALAEIRRAENQSVYVVGLIHNLQTLPRHRGMINKLRFLAIPREAASCRQGPH